jgi:hypothetical protein
MNGYTISAPVWEGERAPLAKAFVAAQKATESVKKAATNPAFKTRYADLAHVVEGVIPALNAAGVAVMQAPAYDGDMVGVTTTLVHESGACVSSTLLLRPSKSDPQGVGSAITYARRYSLLAMTGAAPEDDDGNAASGPRQDPDTKRADPKPPTLAERSQRFEATLKGLHNRAELEKAYKLASGLLADLDQKDPERLAEVNFIYEGLLAETSKEAA